ncbi:MAG: hypothetical protein JO244_04645, partial [Solirubrobacterales bacterium]|nr:hypothetical protein [Solirubrobacterales bacterium]
MSDDVAQPTGDGGSPEAAASSQDLTPPAESQTRPGISRSRHIWVNVIIVITTVLAVVGMLSVYANRLLFNPDNWENTSTQLLQDPNVRSATANYLVDQLYSNVNVAGALKSGLPTQLQPLAGPAAGALRNVAVQGTELALTRPVVQTAWAKANRAADQAFIALVNGGTKHVSVNQGVVTLNLATILDDVASRLGLPSSLVAKLPPSAAHLTILRSNQIKYVQNIGKVVRHLALWLTIIVPLLYAAAIALARGRRRRTLMTVGFSIVLAGLLGVAGRKLLENNVTNALVSDASLRPAVGATLRIGTSLL